MTKLNAKAAGLVSLRRHLLRLGPTLTSPCLTHLDQHLVVEQRQQLWQQVPHQAWLVVSGSAEGQDSSAAHVLGGREAGQRTRQRETVNGNETDGGSAI